ncbi:MAG: C40 family peptidase [Bacilli bacterium]
MKKKIFLIITLLTCFMYFNSGISLQGGYIDCGGTAIPAGLTTISKAIVNILQIVTPIGIIIFGILDFLKAIISPNAEEIAKHQKMFMKRLALGALVFFVITFVRFIADLTSNQTAYTKCLSCLLVNDSNCGGEVDAPFDSAFPTQDEIFNPDKDFVQPPLRDDAYEDDEKPSTEGSSDIISYAKKWVGTAYIYGGNTLIVGNSSKGVDCSGFTQQVFKNFGIDLPRVADDQANSGTTISGLSNAKAGDLLFFDWDYDGVQDHVSIYLGNNEKIHASGNPGCSPFAAGGCQVKVDSSSMDSISKIKRVSK